MLYIPVVLMILAWFCWFLKAHYHYKYFYELSDIENFEGLVASSFRLSFFKTFRAFLPVPITGSKIAIGLQKRILLCVILFWTLFAASFFSFVYLQN